MEDNTTEQDDSKVFSISLDDIENEYLTIIDKKANFSVKYGDFLTNCDMMDLDGLNQISDDTQIALKGFCTMDPYPHIPKDRGIPSGPIKSITHITKKQKNLDNSSNIMINDNINKNNSIIQVYSSVNHNKTLDINNKSELQQKEEDTNTMNLTFNVSLVPIEFDENKQNQQNSDQPFEAKVFDETKSVTLEENKDRHTINERKKIRIISEKKISDPVPLIGKLEPLSPTRVLTFPNKKNYHNLNQVDRIQDKSTNNITETTIDLTDTIKNNILVPADSNSDCTKINNLRKNNYSPKNSNTILNNNNDILPKTSLLKNKIPPERVAAIAEKRKFNMKLRDIIEDCLDKLDDPDKSDYENSKLPPKSKTVQNREQQVGSYLAKQPELPNIHEYTIAYLEARMKKMENNLMNKIDQNSQSIKELKQNITPAAPTSRDKKTVHSQTSLTEDQHKKQLYQEISKYLSPEANSLIYEELFINKYTQQLSNTSPSIKRRKCRR